MLLVHKIELKLNNKQQSYFAKACGVARFAYNWALDQWRQQYQAGEPQPVAPDRGWHGRPEDRTHGGGRLRSGDVVDP